MFDYINKIKKLWKVIANSQENWPIKVKNILNGSLWSLDFLIKAAISAPVQFIYNSEENQASETINVLIKDPNNELDMLIDRWEKEKAPLVEKNQKIELIHSTPDGYKLVSFPRYKPFTKICGYLTDTSKLEVLEVGGQSDISIDVILGKDVKTPEIEKARVVYETKKLQDPQELRYVTYFVGLSALKNFQRQVGTRNIEHIHE